MSAQNRTAAKKIRQLERALRKGRLPAKIDLVEWLMMHGHAQTKGSARRMIIDGRVKADSHSLGVHTIEDQQIFDPYVPASLRSTLRVEAPGG